jgi:hypothetical protein
MERDKWHLDPVRARIDLKFILGDILSDQARYQSSEFDEVINDINDCDQLIHDMGLYDEAVAALDRIHRPTTDYPSIQW